MIVVVLELVAFVVLPVVALLYGGYRLYRELEERFALGGGETVALAKMEEARRLSARIRGLLPAETAEAPGVIARELEDLVDRRLPAAFDRQQRLLEHLSRKNRARLVQEQREIRRKLSSARDPELEALHRENLDAARERLETYDRLELASRMADARIRAVLLGLESLEDRLVASEFAKVDRDDLQLEALSEDVKLLEAAYDEIELG